MKKMKTANGIKVLDFYPNLCGVFIINISLQLVHRAASTKTNSYTGEPSHPTLPCKWVEFPVSFYTAASKKEQRTV